MSRQGSPTAYRQSAFSDLRFMQHYATKANARGERRRPGRARASMTPQPPSTPATTRRLSANEPPGEPSSIPPIGVFRPCISVTLCYWPSGLLLTASVCAGADSSFVARLSCSSCRQSHASRRRACFGGRWYASRLLRLVNTQSKRIMASAISQRVVSSSMSLTSINRDHTRESATV